MALITCPECGGKVSDKADACIHCGYPLTESESKNDLVVEPIKEYDESIIEIQEILHSKYLNRDCFKIVINEFSGECYKTGDEIDLLSINNNVIGNKRINNIENINDLTYLYCWDDGSIDINSVTSIKNNNRQRDLHKKLIDERNKTRNSENHEVTCPTCGSTNVKRVKASEKVTNIALFGLFGNKRTKQFHCNNCGYEW